jgi:hypothetical protein
MISSTTAEENARGVFVLTLMDRRKAALKTRS